MNTERKVRFLPKKIKLKDLKLCRTFIWRDELFVLVTRVFKQGLSNAKHHCYSFKDGTCSIIEGNTEIIETQIDHENSTVYHDYIYGDIND